MREMVDRCWGRKSKHGTHRLQQWSAIVYPFDSDYTTKIFVHDFRLGRKSRMRIPRFSSRPYFVPGPQNDFRLVSISSLDPEKDFRPYFRPWDEDEN